MRKYIIQRIIQGTFVIWLVATLVFLGLRALPGGPALSILGETASDEAVRELQAELGLNRPIWAQYIDWMTDLITLQFGTSLTSEQTIFELLSVAAPRTVSIATVGVIVGLSVALPAGVISSVYKGNSIDNIATVTAFLGLSMPAFFIGIVLAVIFGVWLGWLPVFGYSPIREGLISWFKSILLPGIAVGAPYSAIIMRMMRSSLLEEQGSQYMKTAKAKGLDPKVRLYKHAIPEALIPVVTVAGIQLALIVIGSVTVELVFGIKGIGRLFVTSMLEQDYPVTQVTIILISAVLIFMNLFIDILYTFLDPRIQYGGDEV